MVGGPGSGKSTYATSKMADYVLVSNEHLKNKQNCLKACNQYLATGLSVVVDNTNANKEVRQEYIQAAKTAGVPVRCFYMQTAKETCMHNNLQRKINEHRAHLSKAVPSVVIHSFFKNAHAPTVSEGFESVIKIDFSADSFENSEDQRCYDATNVGVQAAATSKAAK